MSHWQGVAAEVYKVIERAENEPLKSTNILGLGGEQWNYKGSVKYNS